MTTPDDSTPGHDPFAALRQRNFQYNSAGRLASSMAMTLLTATIFWQVYDLTDSTLQLAMVGLARFLPSLGVSLVAGAVADSHDKRKISSAAQGATLLCALVLLAVSAAGEMHMALIYGLTFLVALASTFDAPARGALLPQLVTRDTFANAITVSSTFQQLGFVTGPVLAGLLIALGDPELAYGAYCVLVLVSILTYLPLRLLPNDVPKRAVSVSAIVEGVEFVRKRQVILGAMTLDMFAVIFGGAQALLPVYAKDILDVGALGYGLLAASLDLGALSMAVLLVLLPPVKQSGKVLLYAVAGFGLGTIVFGFSRNFALSLAAYAVIGMSDQVSVVMRQTTIQLATPDALRGRVTSVNMLFIGASNQLGAVESGLVAAATSATFAVVTGGIGCLVVLGLVAVLMPELRRYRTDRPLEGDGPPEASGEREPEREAATSSP
jgi:MFS family permease